MKLLLRYPHHFDFNAETSADNEFQQSIQNEEHTSIRTRVQREFEHVVAQLKLAGIRTVVMDEIGASTASPDALFPNNWFSTHENGLFITYPMLAENRRTEVNSAFIRSLGYTRHFDLEGNTAPEKYLEGTGSLIFDHQSKIIYASRSERTNEELVQEVANVTGYQPFVFDAIAPSGKPIYHTNVIMHTGVDYVCAGTDLMPEPDRSVFIETVQKSGKALIELSSEQIMQHFAGNMLQVINDEQKRVLLLSENAFRSLNETQKEQLGKYNDLLLPIRIPTIEAIGGGSIRCMVAELY